MVALEAGGRDNVTAVVVDAVAVTGGVTAGDDDTLPPGSTSSVTDDDTVELPVVIPAPEEE